MFCISVEAIWTSQSQLWNSMGSLSEVGVHKSCKISIGILIHSGRKFNACQRAFHVTYL